MKIKSNDLIMQNKVFMWIALATGLILLIPLIAMQFTSEVDWGLGDFVVIGTLLFGTGSMFVLAARKVDERYRVAIGIFGTPHFLLLTTNSVILPSPLVTDECRALLMILAGSSAVR